MLEAEADGEAPYLTTTKGKKRPLTPRLFTPRSNVSSEYNQNDDFSPSAYIVAQHK